MTLDELRERRLRAALLIAPREHDRLVLDDATLAAALDGSTALTGAERAALAASPLTIRRLRQLSQDRMQERTQDQSSTWRASAGMLRAADSGAALAELVTDDGCWTLHFAGARVILQLAARAPFARQVLADRPMLRVVDGAGAVILQGRLDSDGECEGAWPFALAPGPHFQQAGAVFAVEALPA